METEVQYREPLNTIFSDSAFKQEHTHMHEPEYIKKTCLKIHYTYKKPSLKTYLRHTYTHNISQLYNPAE